SLSSLSLGSFTPTGSSVSYQPKFGSNSSGTLSSITSTSDTIKISSTQNSVALTPTVPANKGMTIKVTGGTISGQAVTSGSQITVTGIANGSTITIEVSPEDPTAAKKTYTYTCQTVADITTAKSISFTNQNSNAITPTTKPSGDPLPAGEWAYTIPYATNGNVNSTVSINVTPVDGSTATPNPTSVTFTGTGSSTVTVTVKVVDSTTGTETNRTLKITRAAASSETGLASNGIKVTYTKNGTNTLTGSLSGNKYTCSTKLPYDINTVNLQITLKDATFAKWSYSVRSGVGSSTGSNLASGANPQVILESPGQNNTATFTIDVVVTAQDGTTANYEVEIQRNGADDDSTLSTLGCSNVPTGASMTGNTPNNIAGTVAISSINLDNKPSQLSFTAVATKSTSKIKVYDSNNNQVNATAANSVTFNASLANLTATNTTITYKIRVESEAYAFDNTKYTEYNLTISATPPTPKDNDPSVTKIEVVPTGSTTTTTTETMSLPNPLTINWPNDVAGAQIKVTPTKSTSKVTIKAVNGTQNFTNSLNTTNLTISSLPEGTTNVTITVVAEDGTPNPDNDFSITIIKAKAPSKEKGVTQITIGGKNVPVPTGVSQGGTPTPIAISKPTSGTTVPIVVRPKDTKSKVTISGATEQTGTTLPTFDFPFTVGLNKVTVNVQPEDQNEAPESYEIDLWVNEDQTLSDLRVEISGDPQTLSPSFFPTTSGYTVSVPFATQNVDLIYALATTANPQNLVVTIRGGSINSTMPVNGPYKLNVPTTATTQKYYVDIKQNTTITNGIPATTTYEVTINKTTADTQKKITSLTDPDPSSPIAFNQNTNAYIKVLPHNTTSYKFTGLTYSPKVDLTVDASSGLPKGVATTGTWKNGNDPTEVTFSVKQGGIKKHTITVTAEDGSTNIYEFYFVCANDLGDITGLTLTDGNGAALVGENNTSFAFNKNAATQTKLVLENTYANKAISINIEKEENFAAAYVAPSATYHTGAKTESHSVLSLGTTNTFKVRTVSELRYVLEHPDSSDDVIPATLTAEKNALIAAASASIEYTIEIEVKGLDQDATLKQLEVYVGTNGTDRLAGKFVPGSHGSTYTIGDLGNSNNFSISIKADTTKATSIIAKAGGVAPSNVSSTGITLTDGSNRITYKDQTISLQTSGSGSYSFVITITTTAQDSNVHETYTIELTRGDVDPDNDATIANIYLQDNNNKKDYISFDPTTSTYTVTIPAGVESYNLVAETLTGSLANISINGQNEKSHYEGKFDSAYWLGTNPQTQYTYTVQGLAANGNLGAKVYTVTVTLEKPSNNADLDELRANGQNLDVTQTLHNLSVPYETTAIPLYVKTADPEAMIRIVYQDGSTDSTHKNIADIPQYKLNEGPNTISVIVTAQDGTPKTYQIVINRSYKDPRLATLGVLGYPLLENDPTKEIEVEFDPELKEYRVNVPYIKEQAEIFATPENVTDIVTGIGIKNLLVGENNFIVAVSSPSGSGRTEYKVVIRRYSADEANADAAFAEIKEIPEFKEEFNPVETMYEYHVTNDITKLTPYFTAAKAGVGKSNVDYYGTQLHSGENALVVVITAPDGITTKTYVVKVTRDKMAYEVKENTEVYPNYTVEAGAADNQYIVNIGKAKSVDVDFTKFIFPATDNLEIKVISDVKENPNEVIITIFDGEETEFVKLVVESTGNPTNGGINWLDFWPLLLL
ncbi:MAG: cadherin-like beta sandwich domain-containing protein, partial [Anaeroplasmataceae bacterium]|nr:cadherin-like beta sandwich domain-containing protein [Anaeroplasmataceae bacterium]